MMKRATWFVGGIAAGAAGGRYAKRKVRTTIRRRTDEMTDRYTAAKIAGSAASGVRRGAFRIAEAVREGRQAMINTERELRARRDMTAESIDERLEPGDQLLVDGKPVDTARVIVLRPRTQAEGQRRRRGRRSS